MMDTKSRVYTGAWTDWSEGKLYGSRITLTQGDSMYAIAFLAIFVRLVGQHFWSIFRYVTFQLRVTPRPQDGLYLQQQALLRNNLYDAAGVWQFLRVGFAWRGRVPRAIRRSIGVIAYACLHISAFTTAGIFVSRVANTKSGVLLRGAVCGTWVNPFAFEQFTQFTQHDLQARNKWQGWHVENVKSAATFAQQCYNTTEATSSLANCKAYGPCLMNWTVTTNINCPFEQKICIDSKAVRFDSGLLDSQDHFGINAQHDRVKYRSVLECAPLAQEGYRSDLLNSSDASIAPLIATGIGDAVQGESFREFYYGQSWYFNTSATFVWNNLSFGLPMGNMEIPRYLLDVENSVLGNLESGTFTAIPELNRTNADVVLFFLMSNTAYLNKVDDPWFKATRQRNVSQQAVEDGGHPATVKFYLQDNNASVMGCAQQHQFCNRDGSRCSKLTGGAAISNTDAMLGFAKDLDLTPRETAIQQRLYRAAWNSWVYQTSGYLEGTGLLAAQVGSNDVTSDLPDNQWILELQAWFATGLTGIQMELASFVAGIKDASVDQYITQASSPEERWMCDSQIVQRDGYNNISTLGIGLIVGVGGLIIVVDLTLHRIARTFRALGSRDGDSVGMQEWEAMEALQLMRTAYRNGSQGVWQGKLGEIPVTEGHQTFLPFDLAQASIGRDYLSWKNTDEPRSSSSREQEQEVKNGLVFSDTLSSDSVVR